MTKNKFLLTHVAATVSHFQTGGMMTTEAKAAIDYKGNDIEDCIANAKNIADKMEAAGIVFEEDKKE